METSQAWEHVEHRIVVGLRRRKVAVMVASAAVTATVVGGMLLLTNLLRQPDYADVPPSTTTTVATTVPETASTTVTSTTTTTPSTSTTAPNTGSTSTTAAPYLRFREAPLPAGTYRTVFFSEPFTVDLPEGWFGLTEYPTDVSLAWGRAFSPDLRDEGLRTLTAVALDIFRSTPPADLAEQLLAQPELARGVLTPTTLGGADGVAVEGEISGRATIIDALSDADPSDFDADISFGTSSTLSYNRFYVLDVAGRTVVIWIEAPPNEFADHLAILAPLLESLRFTALD